MNAQTYCIFAVVLAFEDRIEVVVIALTASEFEHLRRECHVVSATSQR